MPSRRAPKEGSLFYEIGGWLLLLAILAAIIQAITGNTQGTMTGNCDPAYPDFCITAPPPDLDCRDVAPRARFKVLPPDPHRFDQDGNGIGCETP